MCGVAGYFGYVPNGAAVLAGMAGAAKVSARLPQLGWRIAGWRSSTWNMAANPWRAPMDGW